MLLLLLILLSFCYHYYYEFSICNNLFFGMKIAKRFSGKSSFNKLSLLIGVPLKSQLVGYPNGETMESNDKQ